MMLNADSNENCKKINGLFSKKKQTNKQTTFQVRHRRSRGRAGGRTVT